MIDRNQNDDEETKNKVIEEHFQTIKKKELFNNQILHTKFTDEHNDRREKYLKFLLCNKFFYEKHEKEAQQHRPILPRIVVAHQFKGEYLDPSFQELIRLIQFGDASSAVEMVKKNPVLLLHKGNIINSAGNQMRMTVYQYIVSGLDHQFEKIFRNLFICLPNGEDERLKQIIKYDLDDYYNKTIDYASNTDYDFDNLFDKFKNTRLDVLEKFEQDPSLLHKELDYDYETATFKEELLNFINFCKMKEIKEGKMQFNLANIFKAYDCASKFGNDVEGEFRASCFYVWVIGQLQKQYPDCLRREHASKGFYSNVEDCNNLQKINQNNVFIPLGNTFLLSLYGAEDIFEHHEDAPRHPYNLNKFPTYKDDISGLKLGQDYLITLSGSADTNGYDVVFEEFQEYYQYKVEQLKICKNRQNNTIDYVVEYNCPRLQTNEYNDMKRKMDEEEELVSNKKRKVIQETDVFKEDREIFYNFDKFISDFKFN